MPDLLNRSGFTLEFIRAHEHIGGTGRDHIRRFGRQNNDDPGISRKTKKAMEDTMTTPALQVIPSVEMVASELQATHMRVVHAFDTFAKARMHDAVPQWQLRRAQRELDRHRRLMRAKRLAVKAVRTGR
jgi:hypothetical protein